MSSSSSVSSSAVLPSSTPMQFSSLLEANTYRVKAIVERLTFIMNSKSGAIRFDSSEFFSLCIALARGVDYALTINDVPAVAHRLPSLIKQVYQRRNESYLQPALMVLMISVKNACKNGWFITADADELHKMTKEFFSIFCMTVSVNPIVGNALDIISNIVSRFYPQFKLCSLLDSFEAKPGYEILMSDFQIPRNIHPEEKIMLIVVRTDNLETASCIISPPQVSFLVNGKGVDKRTNISLDNGPQFPSDITKMLKFGLNIIQSIGYFAGTYIIALAFMSKITLSKSPILEDYVHPVTADVGADSEIIEGASRITLNCPISLRRIRTSVKGYLCKHHQCFDYDNYMEMNSRKPSWRCPFCNQPVSFIDLRIDQNMVKILKDVGEDVIDIVISADGSWKVLSEHNGTKDQEHKEKLSGQPDFNMESRSANAVTEAVDLTMGEDEKSDSTMSPCQVGPLINSVSQNENHIIETEDRKPLKDNGDFTVPQHIAEAQLTNYASMTVPLTSQSGNATWPSMWSSLSSSSASFTLTAQDDIAAESSTSILPALLANPVVTDAVSPSLIPEPLASVDPSQPNFSSHQISQFRTLADIMHLQPHLRNPMFSYEPERVPIPRRVNRNPIAVQALPVQSLQTQTISSFKRMRINGPSSSSFNTKDSPSVTYETVQPVTISDGLTATSGDNDMQHVLGTSSPSISQDDACVVVEPIVIDYTDAFTTDIVFSSRQEILNWVRDVGNAYGLVISLKRSENAKPGKKPRLYFACERSGSYRSCGKSNGKSRVSHGTKKCGCPFYLKGIKLPTNDDWQVMVVCGTHNHPTAKHLEGHSFAGRLHKEEFEMLIDMSVAQDRDHQNHQQIRSPEFRHVVNLPAPNLMGTRIPSSMQRGAGAYRSSLQSSSNTRTPLVPPTNFRNPQASLIMSNALRSNTALPLGVTRELARQVAQQMGQVQAGAANPQASRAPESSTSAVCSSRLSVEEPSRNVAELQPNKNWRPTGRMRGSLTGNAYSAALNQYATPTTLVNPVKLPEPSVLPPTSDQLPSISSNVSAQGSVAEQAIINLNDSGSQPGGSTI